MTLVRFLELESQKLPQGTSISGWVTKRWNGVRPLWGRRVNTSIVNCSFLFLFVKLLIFPYGDVRIFSISDSNSAKIERNIMIKHQGCGFYFFIWLFYLLTRFILFLYFGHRCKLKYTSKQCTIIRYKDLINSTANKNNRYKISHTF